jgi:DNA-binding NtrC family response regulator
MSQAQYPSVPVLLIDDEQNFLNAAALILAREGITHSLQCQDSREAMPTLETQEVSAIILDMYMPHVSGQELLPLITQDFPDTPVVVLTAVDDVKTAVKCMKAGAFDYLVKPADAVTLAATVRRALKYWEVNNENRLLKRYLLSDDLDRPEAFTEIVTGSKAMRSIFQYAEAIAGTNLPVLITGETGVGKELMAQAIHCLSGRKGEFVPVNIAGLDDNLFTDTLFGHVKGSFTGAERERSGLIEQAAAGTLFLDEIGELAVPSQVKLLRLLQEGKYYPLGSDKQKASDARIIVATNKDLNLALKNETLRKDLYFRLRGHHLHVPPLRQRREDVPLLFSHFLSLACKSLHKEVPSFPPELLTLLSTYHFPGNIRELQAMVYDAVTRHRKGILAMGSFKEIIQEEEPIPEPTPGKDAQGFLWRSAFNGRFPTLKEVEDSMIAEALEIADGNQGIAASMLGINRKTLNKRLNKDKE